MSQINIKKIAENELNLIQEMAKIVFPITYKNIISEAQIIYMLDLMYNIQKLTEQIQQSHDFYIFEKEGQNVGFASIRPGKEVSKLEKLYVMPSFQGQKIGEYFLNFVTELLDQNHEIILNVNKENPAFFFYKKQGFTIKESMILDIGNGYIMNDYVLSKIL